MDWKYNIELRYEDGDIGHFSILNKKANAAIEEARNRANKEVDHVKEATFVPLEK